MKSLKILSLGIGIWAIGLIWPEINRILTAEAMLMSVIVLSLIVIGHLLMTHRLQPLAVEESVSRRERQHRPPHDSHPIKPVTAI